MKKSIWILLIIFLLMACTNSEITTIKFESPATKVTQPAIDIEEHLLQQSDELMRYLKKQDFEQFKEHVDPVEGVLFSFFADFGNPKSYGGPYLKLKREQLNDNETEYIWGYDDSDKAFKMTLPQYVNDFLLKRHGHEIIYTNITFNDTAFENANIKNTIHEYYPDAKFVEYYSPPLDKNGRLFQAIRFVYQERDGEWYLIGIARDVSVE